MMGTMFPVPGTRTWLSVGRHGTGQPEMKGQNCYGPGTSNVSQIGQPDGQGNFYCYDPSNSNKGPHSWRYVFQVMAWDALDFAAVKAGTKKPWDLKPYAAWDAGAGSPLSIPGIAISGGAYDPSTGRLYVSTGWTDVYVFDVGAGGPPPPPGPIDCQGVWSDSLSEPTPLVCDATRMQTRTRTRTFTVTTQPSNGGKACPASPVVTTETTACDWDPPPPPPVPFFVGAIRAQSVGSWGLRITMEVPKAQTVPAKGAKVTVALPPDVVAVGTVYAILSPYSNGNQRVVVELPGRSAVTIKVEIP
jgi:hypothetical protein